MPQDTSLDIAGVGNAIVDVIASVDDDFLQAHDVAKGRMTLIDEPRAEALYAAMGAGRAISGGSAANTLAGLASLGASGGYIGKVADDQLGGIFAHDLRAAGVAYGTPPLTGGPSTARCLIAVTPDGERSMNTFLGASTLFSESDLDPDMIRGAKAVFLEGYLFDKDEAKQAFVAASEIAAAAGRKVALTLSDLFCVERHRASFRYLVKSHVDILFANEDEIVALYEAKDFDDALIMAREECEFAALTRSEKGSVVVSSESAFVVPADPVENVVDATGAGDLYAAGFLHGWARGRSPYDCGRLGTVAAAEVISHYGARPETSLKELARAKGL